MKNVLLILVVVIFSKDVYGQNWSEWFDQKSTQKKYLIQQIAALKVYAGYAAKGYEIVKSGLGVIKNGKKGDFDLHSDYFTSLTAVNPSIKKYSKVLAIFSMQVSMVIQARAAIRKFKTNKQFTDEEIRYIRMVAANILTDIIAVQDKLAQVLKSHTLQLKDDERIKVINQLFIDTQEQQTCLGSFTQDVFVLAAQRSSEENNLIRIKKLIVLP